MYDYLLNITLQGKHYVRVAIPSGATAGEARRIGEDFQTRFPVFEGYEVTMTATGRTSVTVPI